jgi:hypothetical protein
MFLTLRPAPICYTLVPNLFSKYQEVLKGGDPKNGNFDE